MERSGDLSAQICEVLKPFAPQDHVLGGQTEFVADLGLDSVRVMELLLEIEEQFDVSIPLNVLPDVRTVDDLASQLEKMTAESPEN